MEKIRDIVIRVEIQPLAPQALVLISIELAIEPVSQHGSIKAIG